MACVRLVKVTASTPAMNGFRQRKEKCMPRQSVRGKMETNQLIWRMRTYSLSIFYISFIVWQVFNNCYMCPKEWYKSNDGLEAQIAINLWDYFFSLQNWNWSIIGLLGYTIFQLFPSPLTLLQKKILKKFIFIMTVFEE